MKELQRQVHELDIYVTITTSTLSIIGALIIIITSTCTSFNGGTLGEHRKLLIHLTIADYFIAVGNLIGAIRFTISSDNISKTVSASTDNISKTDPACPKNEDIGCIVQSFISTMSSMSSFFWTTIIIFHLWSTYKDYLDRKGNNQASIGYKRIITYYAISWGIPAAITFSAQLKNALGSDMFVGSGAWCWISDCLSDRERTIWMTVSGKGWEILMYFAVFSFYILLKVFKKIYSKRNLKIKMDECKEKSRHPNENIKFLYLWLAEVGLRSFGTIRFIMAAARRHTGFHSYVYDHHVDTVFMHIQSFGDSAQALTSCLIFCVLKKKNLKLLKSLCFKSTEEETTLLDDSSTNYQEEYESKNTRYSC